MPGDDEFLVGRDNPGRYAAARSRDPRLPGAVGVRIQLDAQPRRRVADPASDFRGILANASREHEGVDSTQDGGQRSDFLRGAIDEIVHRQPRRRLRAAEKIAHVVALAGYAEEPRLLVENGFNVLRREPEVLEEIEDDTGIDGAGPRSHA